MENVELPSRKAWAIKGGRIILRTISESPKSSKEKAKRYFQDRSWKHLSEIGYQCVQVRVDVYDPIEI